MAKKLSMLIAAVAAVAFVVPALASANTPTLFDHEGKVGISKRILATSTNTTVSTSLGLLKCGKLTITIEVTHNSAATVRGIGKGVGTTSSCEIATSPPKSITITDVTLAEIHTSTPGKGTINITLEADIPISGGGVIKCHFASASVPFNYTVGITNDIVTIANGNLVGTGVGCEPGLLNADFTLETDESPFAPVWFQ